MSSKKVELRLDWCSHKAAKYAVENWHYSKSLPTPPLVKIGVWENNKFIGCVLFSRGTNQHQHERFGVEYFEIAELSRIALGTHKSTVTSIIKIALKLLLSGNRLLKIVVSYADSNQGHYGTIYQAANWIYLGPVKSTPLYEDKNKRIWHSRQVSKRGFNRQYGKYRIVPNPDSCAIILQLPKHKYIYPLDKYTRKKIQQLAQPYPKRPASIDSDASAFQAEEGGAIPTAGLIGA